MSEEKKPVTGDNSQGSDELTLHVASLWASVLPSLQTKIRASVSQNSGNEEKTKKLEDLLGKFAKASGFMGQDDLYSDQFATSLEEHLEKLTKSKRDQECSLAVLEAEKTERKEEIRSLQNSLEKSLALGTSMEEILRKVAGKSGYVLPPKLTAQTDLDSFELHLTAKLKSEVEFSSKWEQAKLLFGDHTSLHGTTSGGTAFSDSTQQCVANEANDDSFSSTREPPRNRRMVPATASAQASAGQRGPNKRYFERSLTKFPVTTEPHVATDDLTCSCGYKCTRRRSLERHINKMTREWRFQCETCKYYFFYNCSRATHYAHNKRCGEAKHKLEESSVPPPPSKRVLHKSQAVEEPKKKIKTRSQQAKIWARGIGQRKKTWAPCGVTSGNPEDWKFPCQEDNCTERFQYLADLKLHMKKHGIENPYKEYVQGCRFCGKMFTQVSEIYKHRKDFRRIRQQQTESTPADPRGTIQN